MEGGQIEEKIDYSGGCHCQAIRFEVKANKFLTVIKCNCSICIMKQNHHFIVPKEDFKLVQGEELLTTYTFNTKTAQHKFCKVCGVQSFYIPRSHPHRLAVTFYCLDKYPKINYKIIEFDGVNWEKEMETNSEIKQF